MIISTQDMVDYTSDTAQAEQFLLDVTQATALKLNLDTELYKTGIHRLAFTSRIFNADGS